jgi:hypothetical protein
MRVWIIEDRADRVALALLAPPEVVLKMADVSAESFEKREEELTTMLKTQFGLPSSSAIVYAKQLLNSLGRGPSWTETYRKLKAKWRRIGLKQRSGFYGI